MTKKKEKEEKKKRERRKSENIYSGQFSERRGAVNLVVVKCFSDSCETLHLIWYLL